MPHPKKLSKPNVLPRTKLLKPLLNVRNLSGSFGSVEQLRRELQVSEARPQELIDLGRVLEQQCRAELTEAEAELNAAGFQLSQAKIEAQVKDREIHRLRQAAPSATDAIESPKPASNQCSFCFWTWCFSGDSVPQPTFPASDSRVDELIEAVQQLASRLEQPNGTDQGGIPAKRGLI